MDPQEQADLEKMKAEQQKIKLETFEYLRHLTLCDAEMLVVCGHRGKSQAEAMRDVFVSAQKRIDKLAADHVKKYPD